MGTIRRQCSAAVFACLAFCCLAACTSNGPQHARIETPYGDIRVMLYDATPQHRDNFISLVNQDFYDSLLFHRVMQNFMVQGGDPVSRTATPGQALGNGGPGYTIPAEIGAPHIRGALAAARLSDGANPQRESSGSQFYIVQGQVAEPSYLDNIERSKKIKYNAAQRELYTSIGGTPQLDGDYTVFGEVVSGMEVIDEIAAQRVDRANRPEQDIWMRITLD